MIRRVAQAVEQLDMFTAASDYCQRSTHGEQSFRHRSDGGFFEENYFVAPIDDDTTARNFIKEHHYAGTYVVAKYRYGLWQRTSQSADQLVGVAVLSLGSRASLPKAFPDLIPNQQSLDLGRFVLVDEVPANGETWFLSRVNDLASKRGVRGLTSFADPLPRYAQDGTKIFVGHYGTIYQASNAIHSGSAAKKIQYLFEDATALDPFSLSKIFSEPKKVGWRYVEAELLRHGLDLPEEGEPRGDWTNRMVVKGALRGFHHPGNIRYLFALGTPAQRRALQIGYQPLAYPKRATYFGPGGEDYVPSPILPKALRTYVDLAPIEPRPGLALAL